jgi:fructuronate reductase/mannitol 2-dehydrogenase
VPTYDRTALTAAVVHLGVGGFHRAHQAVYLDELARRGNMAWGELGVGLHHEDMKNALEPQDYLYTLVERDAGGDRARVVGSMGRYLFAPAEPEGVLTALSDPRTRLVTLTITMGGYDIDPVTGDFRAEDPEIQADLDGTAAPVTVFGYICEALSRRRAAGVAPFTILSCDNMQDNGGAARTAVVSFARLRDEDLAQWIEDTVAFPSSMVDRITPETTPEGRDLVARQFGVADRWPVITERFTQWFIQDTFCNERPPLDQVGVQFVPDVTPYMTMKTRLLNASHSALGYLGYLAGHRNTAEAMRDPLIRAYVARLMDDEVTPLLPPVPNVDLTAYKRTLLERFANPALKDELARLCSRGSTKMPTFLLPSIAEALQRGGRHDLLSLAVAGWFRYLRGTDYDDNTIEIKDALKDRLQKLAVASGNDPRALLGERGVFGDLGLNAGFVASLRQTLCNLERDGLRTTIESALERPAPEVDSEKLRATLERFPAGRAA